ncbi:hypothetical protein Rsub_10616 [Raphidocelis subcapitata]|uniref:Pentatricopeptide repeat-containing protein-mitochondrial domain-containing protein n=1 Tax=Raphidocelis subcapitata TaxID=307507 RepID=A0A2V0PIZ7_9CHLO|nr:hypothetical protein Rsub_10616 [Raphidocelis subcapitata]|eukprot:GBF97943.1 hypothetical protein Rsub_10616 [Raphidocelis subcapitata]
MHAAARRTGAAGQRIGSGAVPVHRSQRAVRCRSTADAYTQSLLAAERDGDVLRVMEVVTEARVMKLELPPAALEAGIRTFAEGGQWQRAVDMLEALAAAGRRAELSTSEAVFRALAGGGQAERALALYEALEAGGGGVSGPVLNLVVRTCAAGGQLERALQLLEGMVLSSSDSEEEGVEAITFTAVAGECLKQGLGSKAEEVLDWRDYL